MMNKFRILLLIVVGISLLVSLVKAILLRMPSANRTPARKRLADADWLDDKSKAGSFVKLTGVVRQREPSERLVAPLSENRCVVVHVRAMVRHGRSPRGKLVDKLDIVPFTLEDAEGKVLVEATHALLDISPTRESKVAESRKDKLLSDLGYEDANAGTSKCEETLVEVGHTVTIAGTLVTSPETKITGDAAQPIVIQVERARADLSHEP